MQQLRDPHSAVGILGGRGWIETAMTKWVSGGRVYGREIDGRLRCGFMCRLSPPPPEIWDIRITEPTVHWRVFGRFAGPDTFVATSMRTRDMLGKRSSLGWLAAMKDCERTWQQLFPTTMPFTATHARAYITENCDDFEL
jgi:hypothetical protein